MELTDWFTTHIFGYSGFYNLYIGKLWQVQHVPTTPRLWEAEEERPPEIVDFISGQPQVEDTVKKQLIQLTYDFSLGNRVGKSGNLDGYVITGQTASVANQEFSVAHKWNKIPKFFFIIYQDGKYPIYKGDTAWTADTVYFKCESTDMVFYIILFGEDT